MQAERKAIISSMVAHVIFGLSFPFTKVALSYCTPMTLISMRFIIAFVLLSVIVLSGKAKIDIKGKNMKPLLAMVAFQPIIYFICETYGIQLTTATLSSVFIALIPITTVFVEIIVFKAKMSAFKVACSAFCVFGVILMTVENQSEGTTTILGVVLLIGAVFSAVGYAFNSAKASKEFTSFERTYFMFLFGSLFFTIVAFFENGSNIVAAFVSPWSDINFVVSMLFLGIFCSVVAFYLVNFAYSNAATSKVALYANLVPVISTIVGVLVLGETFGPVHAISTVIIILGLLGFQKAKNRT